MSSKLSVDQPTTEQSELQLQRDCFLWTWNCHPETRMCLWHVTNEMKPYPGEPKRNFFERVAKAKAAGLVPGVSDLHFQWMGQLHVFELKVKKNGLSDEQKKYRDKMLQQGARFYEVRDFHTFKSFFTNILINTEMLKMQVIGHLGKDAEVKEYNGKNVINFSVAHSEKGRDGQSKTTWVECSYWTDKTGIVPYLKKGTQIYTEGMPEVRTYGKNDGTTGVSLTLRVGQVQLLGSANMLTQPVGQRVVNSQSIEDLPF